MEPLLFGLAVFASLVLGYAVGRLDGYASGRLDECRKWNRALRVEFERLRRELADTLDLPSDPLGLSDRP